MVGLVLNGIPALITERVARSFDPTRVALARMTAGAAVFGLWYAAIVGVTGLVTHSWWLAIAAILMALVLGGYTVVWSDDWGELLRRRRWVRAARRSPKLMRRLLRERRACVALIERACSRHHPAGEVPR
jgi:peptidoglycan/LPS O-acetylase OafA/YrhL